MLTTKQHPTFTFDQDRLDALKAIAPQAFADGKINWDVLKEALGEQLEEEGRDGAVPAEHFGLTWPGKRQARRPAHTRFLRYASFLFSSDVLTTRQLALAA